MGVEVVRGAPLVPRVVLRSAPHLLERGLAEPQRTRPERPLPEPGRDLQERVVARLGYQHGDVTVAGDRLTARLRDRARAAGAEVSHYYGAAELSFVAWGQHAGDLRPFPDVETAVPKSVLVPILQKLGTVPQGFQLMRQLTVVMEGYKDAAEKEAFKAKYGVSPIEYKNQKYTPQE